MKTENRILMSKAIDSLSGNWGLSIGTYLVFGLISGVGGVIGLIIGGPMRLGSAIFSLNLASGKKIELSQIFDGFENFAESLVAFLLMALYTFLWSLLFIIPGIVAAISYSQTFFILADKKGTKGVDALDESKAMMYGFRWKFFCLGMRFFGWFILSILTFGIGFLWLIPYAQVSLANFYKDLKK